MSGEQTRPFAVLGFDTSNYRTSVALTGEDGTVLLNFRRLLPVEQGARGLRQSEAVFAHVRQLREAEEKLRAACAGVNLRAVAVSTRPRDPAESYMPVFQVGYTVASLMAAAAGCPLIETTHQRGHLAAAVLGTDLDSNRPFLALHLSGGTTDLLYLEGETLEEIGGSLDLHAGQLVDRAGVAMGLPFPAGEELEKLALRGIAEGKLGCSMAEGDLRCHFSGAEAQAARWIAEDRMSREQIAREIYDFLARTIARMCAAGARKTGARQALIAGGVASSGLLRSLLTARCEKSCPELELHFGAPELSGDNAVGVAMIGWQAIRI